MSGQHRADSALRALAELSVPDPSPQAQTRQRRSIVEHLESMQRAAPRVERQRRLAWLSAAALVLSVLGVLVVLSSGARPSVPAERRTANNAPLPAPPLATSVEQQMALGSAVKTDAGSSVHLQTSLGARISVGGSSELRLAAGQHSKAAERVELAFGSIRVKVPKLGPHRQFRVSTPDTLVIVHGTEFSVSVRKDGHGRPNTLVEVTSGRVEVRNKQAVEFLDAGAAWSSDKVSALAPAASARTPEPTSTPRAFRKTVPNTAAEPTQAAPPIGDLARANSLLRSALEASRQGHDEQALGLLDELLRRFPDSPVADNAKVERFRILKRLGREREAASEASGYLESDPDGFARDEARLLGK